MSATKLDLNGAGTREKKGSIFAMQKIDLLVNAAVARIFPMAFIFCNHGRIH